MKKKLIPLQEKSSYKLIAEKYAVQITNLILNAKIGIHSYEKATKQPIRINIKVSITPPSSFNDNSIKNIVDYEKIVNGVKNIVTREHTNLVEALAQKIADLCLDYEMAESVIIKIEKLEIIDETDSVGIEIEYKKNHL